VSVLLAPGRYTDSLGLVQLISLESERTHGRLTDISTIALCLIDPDLVRPQEFAMTFPQTDFAQYFA
jgi:hypothetical protein